MGLPPAPRTRTGPGAEKGPAGVSAGERPASPSALGSLTEAPWELESSGSPGTSALGRSGPQTPAEEPGALRGAGGVTTEAKKRHFG